MSDDVLDAIARALQLDDVERAHLYDLVQAARQRPTRTSPHRPNASAPTCSACSTPSPTRRLSSATDDSTSSPPTGSATPSYADAFSNPDRPANLARFVFLDQRSRDFYADWDGIAEATVGSLRAEAGRDPYDADLTDLVGQLSMRSDNFRARWATHDVRQYRSGTQPFRHPLVGDLTLNYEAFDLTTDTGQTLIVYTAPPDTPDQAALDRLAAWSSPSTPTSRPA